MYSYTIAQGQLAHQQNYTGITLGTTLREPVGVVCIGKGANADDYGIAIGQNSKAGKNAAAFGENVKAEDNHLVIGKWDLTDVAETNVSERLNKLEELVEKQQELLNALWYHPGMPGALEAEQSFVEHTSQSF
jgi:hypothetical protein